MKKEETKILNLNNAEVELRFEFYEEDSIEEKDNKSIVNTQNTIRKIGNLFNYLKRCK